MYIKNDVLYAFTALSIRWGKHDGNNGFKGPVFNKLKNNIYGRNTRNEKNV